MARELTNSLEDYLETIYVLEQKYRVARVKDIAEAMSVQMPSVTGALKNLKSKGLVNYEKNSYISLTPEGLEIAVDMKRRHSVLRCFLTNILQVPLDKSIEMAHKMEHSMDKETADKLCNAIKYFQQEIFDKESFSWDNWTKILEESKNEHGCTLK